MIYLRPLLKTTLGQGGRGVDSHIKVMEVIVVPFWGCNLWLGTTKEVLMANNLCQSCSDTLQDGKPEKYADKNNFLERIGAV